VAGGVFLNIIQKDSKESKFLEKAKEEENIMKRVLENSERVEHIA